MTTVLLFILGAELLSSGIILSRDDTVLVDLLADEGGHSLGVVLKTRCGVVGCAGAAVCQGVLSKI